MRTHGYLLSVATGVAIATTSSAPLSAQAPAALSGKVSAAGEGAMEGVLVSAKKTGGTITITVVSDAQGRFSFPPRSSTPANTRSRSAPSATISTARKHGRDRAARRQPPTSSSVKTKNLAGS